MPIFLGPLSEYFNPIKDPRQPRYPDALRYSVPACLFTGILLFLGRLGARRQIGLRLRTQAAAELFKTLFGCDGIPHGDTVNDLYSRLSVDKVQEKLTRFTEILIDRKVLYPWRLLDFYYCVAIDATGTLSFSKRHCPHCLTKKVHGKTVYYHNVLQASIVTPAGLVFPLLTEFIENPEEDPAASEEKKKQDCELKAFYRLSQRLDQRFPRLPMALLMDGLYAVGPVFDICHRNGWKFFASLSDDKLPSVNEEFQALARFHTGDPLVRKTGKDGAIQQVFRWANNIEYRDTAKRTHNLDVLECHETKTISRDITTTTFRWVTNFSVDAKTAPVLANNGARLRWKVENETFNVQKNGGFELEHGYTYNENATKIFHLMLQFAHVLAQLVEKGSLFRNAFPKGFGSSKNLAAEILEAVRRIALSAAHYARLVATRIQIRFEHRAPPNTIAAQIYVCTCPDTS